MFVERWFVTFFPKHVHDFSIFYIENFSFKRKWVVLCHQYVNVKNKASVK